ncbi:hypothetical protein GCM10010420_37630 [Streptomyces glaucosporus]|uniref:Uncharacterized protein n=1 Tax=Streptomyces glaucosporus TaxID=284044 RepID=A0ABP5VL77_9ACTN
MGYVLQAVVAREETLRAAARGLPAARTVPLRQGLALLPVTDEFFDAVANGPGGSLPGPWKLPGGFDRTLARWSVPGPVAYVEAEYFGGTGGQSAAVWDAGALALGPLRLAEGEPFPAGGGPVSRALRRLGASAEGAFDEFEAVGLGRHRHTGDWLSPVDGPRP